MRLTVLVKNQGRDDIDIQSEKKMIKEDDYTLKN